MLSPASGSVAAKEIDFVVSLAIVIALFRGRGGSFTKDGASTLMKTVATSPVNKLVPSYALNWKLSTPVKSGFGVYVTTPEGEVTRLLLAGSYPLNFPFAELGKLVIK